MLKVQFNKETSLGFIESVIETILEGCLRNFHHPAWATGSYSSGPPATGNSPFYIETTAVSKCIRGVNFLKPMRFLNESDEHTQLGTLSYLGALLSFLLHV